VSTDDERKETFNDRIQQAEEELWGEAQAEASDHEDKSKRGPKEGFGSFGCWTLADKYHLSPDEFPSRDDFWRQVRHGLKADLYTIYMRLASDAGDRVPISLAASDWGVSRSTLKRALVKWQISTWPPHPPKKKN
jgi:hypothetical protein